jgi:hypothetical protein
MMEHGISLDDLHAKLQAPIVTLRFNQSLNISAWLIASSQLISKLQAK